MSKPRSVEKNKTYLLTRRCAQRQFLLKPLAAINDPDVARKIMRHLGLPTDGPQGAPARAPPDPEFCFDADTDDGSDVDPDGFDPDVDVDVDCDTAD